MDYTVKALRAIALSEVPVIKGNPKIDKRAGYIHITWPTGSEFLIKQEDWDSLDKS